MMFAESSSHAREPSQRCSQAPRRYTREAPYPQEYGIRPLLSKPACPFLRAISSWAFLPYPTRSRFSPGVEKAVLKPTSQCRQCRQNIHGMPLSYFEHIIGPVAVRACRLQSECERNIETSEV